ncbi:MAG: hypothetical protein KC931_15860 [Candidatus Omnitrophica bacterium]|nr:hypothetical protein [Candidatus Omnitrophota bacterium]MCA9416198.1 hypothetical protein [Candidatus Omnitrophota bacterium]MCA9424637.1 hypothetical protein [Candidatus Omnitrophota bacterium]MCA9432448.1 hypothetical protein [Candidatus Omnitrophota bacterium]MCA9441057.1 hypothetical protein [Candidatus Omnitrophota bacterium]
MNLEKDLVEIDRSRRRWRMSAIVVGVGLIASLAWGYDKKMDLNKAVIEGEKIQEAVTSMKAALGNTHPIGVEGDTEVPSKLN